VSQPHRTNISRNHFARTFVLAATAGLAVILAGSASAAPPTAAPPMAAPAPQPQPQSQFNFFFGGFQRPSPPQSASAYAPETPDAPRPDNVAPRGESGSGVAYCVRLCDGKFFPIQRGNASPVETCNSFCPASQTKIFSGGSSIDHSVARDGTRYADLASAFLFRTRIVPGCTCNGRDAFGLASVKPAEDPTLRAGDVVATDTGFMAYRGGGKRNANFTPIDQASGTSTELRRQLSQTKIAPADDTATPPVTSAPAARDSSDHQAQLAR
jgi:hypothetical protein